MTKKHDLPNHVAIICDGNRRWAKEHKLAVALGHKKAADDVFEPLIDHAKEIGLQYLTFWVFSTENWKRDEQEVEALFDIFRDFFDRRIEDWHKKNVCVRTIGDLSKFPQDIQERVARGVALTENNTSLTVVFAMNYGGRDELVRAVRKVASKVQRGELHPDEVSVETISKAADTAGIPDPDYIIRTSGEQRTSGFLLWQSEYAEYAFPEFYFPEFTVEKFDALLGEYACRKRRFGGS